MAQAEEHDEPLLAFGDACSGEFFFDVHLRGDASGLRDEVMEKARAQKKWRDKEIENDLPYWVRPSGLLKPKKSTDFVLGHGQQYDTAVCISDDCYVESRLGRTQGQKRKKANGRIAFAPVRVPGPDDKIDQNWGCVPIGDGRIIDLHKAFAVHASDIRAALEADSLTPETLAAGVVLDLQVRIAAHATRRGPLVAESNASKLASILAEQGKVDPAAGQLIANSLVEISAGAWRVEGRGLEAAGQAFDENMGRPAEADVTQPVAELVEDLRFLRDAAQSALAALESV